MVNSYVPSEAQQFWQSAVFQRDGAHPHNTAIFIGLCMNCFQIDWLEDVVHQVGQQAHRTLPQPNFLLGFVKDKVYKTSVPSFSLVKRRIATAVKSISQEILSNFWLILESLLHAVIQESSGHIER